MKRRIIAIIMLLISIETSILAMPITEIYANEKQTNINMNKIIGEGFNVIVDKKSDKDIKKYENIQKKINDEMNQNTGKMSEKIEKEFNKRGIFDDEIMMLNEETINMLTGENINDIYVYTSVSSTTEENQTVELDLEELDCYYGEKYYGIKSNDEEIIAEIETVERNYTQCSLTGQENVVYDTTKVYGQGEFATAISKNKGSYYNSKSSAKLKKTLYATMDKSTNKIKIVFTAMWLDVPKEQFVDVVELEWAGMVYNTSNSCKVTNKVYECEEKWSKDHCYIIEKNVKLITQECKKIDSSAGFCDAIAQRNTKGIKKYNMDSYDINRNRMVIFISLGYDHIYSYALDEIVRSIPDGQYSVFSYQSESVEVELTLDFEKNSSLNNPYFGCIYRHFYIENEVNLLQIVAGGLGIAGGLASSNPIGLYAGVAGGAIMILTSSSGENVSWCIMGATFKADLKFIYK